MEKTKKPKLNDQITLKSYTIKEFNEIQKKGKNILVELDDVNVQFGITDNAVKAMKHVNLNIYKGEVLGLVGESGSGKSTTGNAIMGLVNRNSGTIKIDGIEMPKNAKKVKGRLRKYFAQQIQMIFQDPATSLDPQKSIRKVLMEGLNNLEIKPVFSRNFDITTINNLYKLLHNKKQPEALDKITLSRAKYLIANNKLDELSNRIYEVGRTELRKMDEDYAHLAATYLDLRKEERKYYFEGKDVDLKMKNHIINDLLESVGLTKQILNRFPLEFSGGQQQRIGISRAVSMQPKLLIADEPISALDVSIQSQVVNIFNDLKQKFNLTILFIAHDLRMVEYISDRIAIMYGGRILEIGDAKEIMRNPIHPYSKSLLSAVPSINKLDEDLKSKPYDHEAETSSLEHYKWFKVEGKNHFVFGAQDKVVRWLNE